MSSSESHKTGPVVWLFLFASAALTLWYARPQVAHSLSFAYQLARVLFSGIVPDLSPNGV